MAKKNISKPTLRISNYLLYIDFKQFARKDA